MFGIETSLRGGWSVIHVGGDLDLASAPEFRQHVVSLVTADRHHLIIDLTTTDHLDSVGIGLILGARKRARTHGGEVCVVCDEPRLLRLLELTGLTQLVDVHRRLDHLAAGDQRTVGA